MHNVFCPKCGHNSGDDWSQCEGSCPMSMSPHYKSPAQEVEKVSDPCEQGFHWIECEGCKDLERRIRNQRLDCAQAQLRNRYYKRVISAIVYNEPKVFMEFKDEGRTIDEVLYIEALTDSEERLRKTTKKASALERRARIAERALDEVIEDYSGGLGKDEYLEYATREIDAEIAQEGR